MKNDIVHAWQEKKLQKKRNRKESLSLTITRANNFLHDPQTRNEPNTKLVVRVKVSDPFD